MTKKKEMVFLFVILFLGLCLRIFLLGHNSFWFDEAGVVVAAGKPTLMETMEIAKSHVIAMPLNYLETRLMLLFGQSEFILRLPSAIWGTFAIFALYKLALKFVRKETAILASLLLAIHPFHIQYSQELRFYAAGSFFYLAGTYFVLTALEKNSDKYWIITILVALFGAYEFPYTVFIWLNGLIFSLSSKGMRQRKKIINLVLAGFVFGLLFLPGFLVFGVENSMSYDHTMAQIIGCLLKGLGWVPEVNPIIKQSFWMTELLFVFFVFGIVQLIKQKNRLLLSLFFSICMQIGAILFTVIELNYFVSSRQFLVFMPVMIIISAHFVINIFYSIKPMIPVKKDSDKIINFMLVNKSFGVILLGAVIFSAIPALLNYYTFQKSNAREVATALINLPGSNETVYCAPAYEPLLFNYYLGLQNQNQTKPKINGIDIQELEYLELPQQPSYLILREDDAKMYGEMITNKGFRVLWMDANSLSTGGHRLYIHY